MTWVRESPLAESSSGEKVYEWVGDDLLLQISVQPRSSSNSISGIHNNRLRIKLTAAPVDGKANQALIKFLSKLFSVPIRQISIEKGETAKTKRVRICSPKNIPDLLKNL